MGSVIITDNSKPIRAAFRRTGPGTIGCKKPNMILGRAPRSAPSPMMKSVLARMANNRLQIVTNAEGFENPSFTGVRPSLSASIIKTWNLELIPECCPQDIKRSA
jgi:hypothetical protein